MSNREREQKFKALVSENQYRESFFLKLITFRITYFFHGLVKRGGRVWVKEVPLVGIRGYLVLAEHAMVTQLGHPLLKQLLRFYLGDTQVI